MKSAMALLFFAALLPSASWAGSGDLKPGDFFGSYRLVGGDSYCSETIDVSMDMTGELTEIRGPSIDRTLPLDLDDSSYASLIEEVYDSTRIEGGVYAHERQGREFCFWNGGIIDLGLGKHCKLRWLESTTLSRWGVLLTLTERRVQGHLPEETTRCTYVLDISR